MTIKVTDMIPDSGMDEELMQFYAEMGVSVADLLLTMVEHGGAYAAVAASSFSAHIIETCAKPENVESALDSFFKTVRDSVNATMKDRVGELH